MAKTRSNKRNHSPANGFNPLQPTITGWLTKSPIKPKDTAKTEQQLLREKYQKSSSKSSKKKDDKSKEKKKVEKGAIKDFLINTLPLNIAIKPVGKASGSRESSRLKKTLSRFNSASSDELPTYAAKRSSTAKKRKLKQSDSITKYGTHLPSAEELITTQNQLSNYKTQVEQAQDVREPEFKLMFTPEKTTPIQPLPLLDCKHLSLEDINRYFKDNLSFLTKIVTGQIYSDRHKRYYNKENVLDLQTNKNLTYSTSTIVFSFEQIDRMIALMRKKFDPEDLKTSYSVKVLVPELCLRIFMDVHQMNKREANQYLLNRPI